jgi:hypothetical protein
MFDFLKNLFNRWFGGTAEFKVSLDTTKNPAVIISPDDKDVDGKKIRWVRAPGQTFKFHRLNGLDQAFFYNQSIDLDREEITCSNRAPANEPADDYWYEIVVRQGAYEYKSTEEGTPPGDKPVIRN